MLQGNPLECSCAAGIASRADDAVSTRLTSAEMAYIVDHNRSPRGRLRRGDHATQSDRWSRNGPSRPSGAIDSGESVRTTSRSCAG